MKPSKVEADLDMPRHGTGQNRDQGRVIRSHRQTVSFAWQNMWLLELPALVALWQRG